MREDDAERVLIVQELGAPTAEAAEAGGGSRPSSPARPGEVPVTRVTVTGRDARRPRPRDPPGSSEISADRERGADEVRSATRIVNRALGALRAAAEDPLVQEIGASQGARHPPRARERRRARRGPVDRGQGAAAAPPRPARRRRAAVTGGSGARGPRRGPSRRDPDPAGPPGRPAGPQTPRRSTGCAPPRPRSRSDRPSEASRSASSSRRSGAPRELTGRGR